MCATSHAEQIRGEAPMPALIAHMPEWPFEKVAERSISFWLQSENLPRLENRIAYDGDKVVLSVTERNEEEAAARLKRKLGLSYLTKNGLGEF